MVPTGDGFTKSRTATFFPRLAASFKILTHKKNITHSSDQQILTGLQAFTISPKKLIAKQILFIINDPQDCALEAPECPGY